jgi:hypothetical protein
MRIAPDRPIVGIIVEEDGQEVAHYFSGVRAAREALEGNIQDALSLAGAWADMDWEETLDALDKIRHESQPTPPIEDL